MQFLLIRFAGLDEVDLYTRTERESGLKKQLRTALR